MADVEACRICDRVVTTPEIAHNNIHSVCEPRKEYQIDVMLFHKKFGLPVASKVGPIPLARQQLRKKLHKEEYEELQAAIDAHDLPEVADGVADLIYVLLGTAIEYGIDMDPIWREVQRTNMAKEGGSLREDGKILKPEGWIPPDIETLLREQGWQG